MDTDIKQAIEYFDKHTGKFSCINKLNKMQEELEELYEALNNVNLPDDEYIEGIINECSDIITLAYHIATTKGCKLTPNELIIKAYQKMKNRIDSGERDYNGQKKPEGT